jgi:hypothetical protein
MKKTLICLLIAAIFTICMPNVAAAPKTKQTTVVDSRYIMEVRGKEQPLLGLLLSNNTTYVNQSVDVVGGLATGTPSALHGIEGATINIQRLNYNGTTWYNLGTLTTLTGKDAGLFGASITPKEPGPHIYRATYDGDSRYAPAISNVVALLAN